MYRLALKYPPPDIESRHKLICKKWVPTWRSLSIILESCPQPWPQTANAMPTWLSTPALVYVNKPSVDRGVYLWSGRCVTAISYRWLERRSATEGRQTLRVRANLRAAALQDKPCLDRPRVENAYDASCFGLLEHERLCSISAESTCVCERWLRRQTVSEVLWYAL